MLCRPSPNVEHIVRIHVSIKKISLFNVCGFGPHVSEAFLQHSETLLKFVQILVARAQICAQVPLNYYPLPQPKLAMQCDTFFAKNARGGCGCNAVVRLDKIASRATSNAEFSKPNPSLEASSPFYKTLYLSRSQVLESK